MNVLGLVVLAIARVLSLFADFYKIILIARVILSWVSPDPGNPIVRFIYQVTEPVLSRIRRLLPASLFKMGFDFSPLIVLILLMLIDTILIGLLFDWAATLRHH